MSTSENHDGWDLHTSGPAGADHTVLLVPGGMCTAAFFDDLMKEPTLSGASIRLVAATVPGFGGTQPLEKPTMENAVKRVGELASDLGCDAVVGHSLGGNLARESGTHDCLPATVGLREVMAAE